MAVTGGLELVLNCDFLVASEQARFADTHARVGVQPGWGITVLLPQAIGLRRAKEMSATGNYIDAKHRPSWGLVNHVVPHAELLPFCRRVGGRHRLRTISAGVQAMFETYDEGSETTAAEAWTVESRNARRWLEAGGGRGEDIANDVKPLRLAANRRRPDRLRSVRATPVLHQAPKEEGLALDVETEQLLKGLASSGAKPIAEMTVEEARGLTGQLADLYGSGPEMAKVEDGTIPASGGFVSVPVLTPSADPKGSSSTITAADG